MDDLKTILLLDDEVTVIEAEEGALDLVLSVSLHLSPTDRRSQRCVRSVSPQA